MKTQDFLKWLDTFLNLEKTKDSSIACRKGALWLDGIRSLCKVLGDPQTAIPCIHIAGSKGKGSTASFVASILSEHGMRCGLYTSPHLTDFRQRVLIVQKGGTMEYFPEAIYEEAASSLYDAVARYDKNTQSRAFTWFELTTAFAFLCFKMANVDFVVYETGLGGLLDATNIVQPKAVILTRIEKEHTEYLGNTIAEIATQKAGIIKTGAYAVVAHQGYKDARDVFKDTCAAKKVECIMLDDESATSRLNILTTADIAHKREFISFEYVPLNIDAKAKMRMLGGVQSQNAVSAAIASKLVYPNITNKEIASGIAKTYIPARFDIKTIKEWNTPKVQSIFFFANKDNTTTQDATTKNVYIIPTSNNATMQNVYTTPTSNDAPTSTGELAAPNNQAAPSSDQAILQTGHTTPPSNDAPVITKTNATTASEHTPSSQYNILQSKHDAQSNNDAPASTKEDIPAPSYQTAQGNDTVASSKTNATTPSYQIAQDNDVTLQTEYAIPIDKNIITPKKENIATSSNRIAQDKYVIISPDQATLQTRHIIPPSNDVLISTKEGTPAPSYQIAQDKGIVASPKKNATTPSYQTAQDNGDILFTNENIVTPSHQIFIDKQATVSTEHVVLPNMQAISTSNDAPTPTWGIVAPTEQAAASSEQASQTKTLILDGAHTPSSIASVLATYKVFFPAEKCTLLFSIASDKDIANIVPLFTPLVKSAIIDHIVLTTIPIAKRCDAQQIAAAFADCDLKAVMIADTKDALAKALSLGKTVLVVGSFYLCSAVIKLLADIAPHSL